MSRLASSGVGLASALVIARSLGPEGRGQTAAVIALIYVAPIVISVGLPVHVRRVAAATGERASLFAARRYGCVLALLSVPVSPLLSSVVLGDDVGSGLFWSSSIAFACFPICVLWTIEQSHLLGLANFATVAVMQLAPPTVVLVGSIVGALAGALSPALVVALAVAGQVANFLVGSSANGFGLGLGTAGPTVAKTVSESSQYAVGASADAAVNRLDQVILLPLLGAYQSGLYAAAVTVGTIPLSLAYALGASEFNRVAENASISYTGAAAAARIRPSAAIGFGLSIVLMITTPIAIPLVFGAAFTDAVVPTLILLSGSCAVVPAFVAVMILSASQRGWAVAGVQMVTLAVAMGPLFVVGPTHGASGAAVVSTCARFVALLLVLGALRVNPVALIPKRGDLARSLRSMGLAQPGIGQ